MVPNVFSLRSFRNMSIAAKLVVPIVAVALVLAVTSFVVINKVQRNAAEAQAAKNADSVVSQMIATRSAYTGNVVGKLKGDNAGVGFSTDFAEKEGFAPLPATLVHKISDIVNQSGAYTIDLISPWPINPEKGPRDDWEDLALNELIGDPSAAFSEVKMIEGRETLRYASADFAAVDACVTCHNNHPDSPRTDFTKGEMMGALVVEMPVDEEFASAATSALWISGGAAGGLTLLVLVVVFMVRNFVSKPVGQVVAASAALAEGNTNVKLESDSNDEIGKLVASFGEITRYNSEMAEAASQIANGDLTSKIEPKSESDVLGTSFSTMVNSLSSVVSDVRNAASAVSKSSTNLDKSTQQAGDASRGLAEVSQQLAEGSSKQSASMESASATLGQLVEGIDEVKKGSAEQAETATRTVELAESLNSAMSGVVGDVSQARSVATEANQTAQQGLQVVSQSIDGMGRIQGAVGSVTDKVTGLGEKSAEIGKIISVIDDIAAQTNLLALNAAIEAARAGEQGRGFAVVADEVRQLAERVTASTTEIASLVKDLQSSVQESVVATEEGTEQVDAGVELVEKTGEVLNRIISAVDSIAGQMTKAADTASGAEGSTTELVENVTSVDQIASKNVSSANEITSATSNATSSMKEIGEITSSNSALAQETSASTEQLLAQVDQVVEATTTLSTMAESLEDSMAGFKLNEDELDVAA